MTSSASTIELSGVRPVALSAPSRLSFPRCLLHVFGLTSFAVAQPLLQRMTDRLPFLVDQDLREGSLVLLCAALVIVPPFLLGLIELVAWLISRRLQWGLHLVLVFLLVWLTVCGAARAIQNEPHVNALGIPWFAGLAVATAVAAITTWTYRQRPILRRFVTVLSVASLLFPLRFLLASPATSLVFPPREVPPPPLRVGNPIPLIMVVFDEFDGLALLDAKGEIDAGLFPNFARLAKEGLWFRNATTNHYRTERAIPAMLTGSIQHELKASTEENYPDNLFALLRRSGQYRTRAYEPFTRLCTPLVFLEQKPGIPLREKFPRAAWTLAAVYRSAVLPLDIPLPELEIPRSWFGITETSLESGKSDKNVVRFSWDSGREAQIEQFLSEFERDEQATFHFLHLGLPHYPWTHLPSGKNYAPRLRYGIFPCAITSGGEDWVNDPLAVQQSWDRYRLQIQFVDRAIGQFIDRLKEQDLWDRSLVIVTADHGAAFTPGISRRYPHRETIPEIACVPLFVKVPGQQPDRASLENRNVEIIDILPTIAEVLNIELPMPVDGQSLLDPSQSERPRKSLNIDDRLVPLRPDFPERFETLARLHQRFGTDRIDPVRDLGSQRRWIGENVADFPAAGSIAGSICLYHGGPATQAGENVVPCFVEGYITDPVTTSGPVYLAVAVNGRIEAVTRTYQDPLVSDCFAALLPEAVFSDGNARLEIFEIVRGSTESLRRCDLVADRNQ